ncbi:MAG: CRISPR-associated helicase Cas3', partial [Aquabacterium sp.]|nr:CRISPR-associated helicase Cas3' [Aquabacterium sp.]
TGFGSGLKQALVLLAALHDVGKISGSFRSMIKGSGHLGTASHWELSEWLLLEKLDEDLLAPTLGGARESREQLYAATAGHHGVPPRNDWAAWRRMASQVGGEAESAAKLMAELFLSFWPEASLGDMSDEQAKSLSWWLPGFVAVSDWVGSNITWFEPKCVASSLAVHLELARCKAKVAVERAGLVPGKLSGVSLFSELALRPLQQRAVEQPLVDGPMLAIVEDETGAGKTEAAFLLAQRMLAQGKGTGIYFALPTMATSNAMFARASKIVGKLFDTPHLTIAHGRAGLNDQYADIIGIDEGTDDNVTCAPWLADSRRKALLAQVGVGTIDQAFLSVLPTKHNCMRIWGLARNILIVDEVHELGNPYMAVELETLLMSHAAQGGSVILLSATLPLNLRQRLANAFQVGAGREPVRLADPQYPALTVVGAANDMPPLPTRTGPRGAVRVVRLNDQDEAVRVLCDAAAKGASCVWVRNAVDEAIAAWDMLKGLGQNPALLHARFAFGDRRRIERDVLERFGRNRESGVGQILVATQVVESSLDLDFDVMVSDLAPMAALIQRCGRLWRHMDVRPREGRPVLDPVLHVLSADPADVTSEHWLKDVLGRGEYVYPVAEQWRTARHLFAAGKIDAPEGLRDLVEAVHGSEVLEAPDTLQRAVQNDEGRMHAALNMGQLNVIVLNEGYRRGGGAADDVSYPTRLGPPQRTLMLLRRENGKLRLWAGTGAEGEMLSEVTASFARLAKLPLPEAGQECSEIQAFKANWPEWKKNATTVVEVQAAGVVVEGLRYQNSCGLLLYNIK